MAGGSGNSGQWRIQQRLRLLEIGKRETEASRNREYFYTASKEKVYNLGEKVVRGFNNDGVAAGIVFQVVEKVKDNLASVRKICGAGNRVVFDDDSPEGSYILNKASGTRTKIELKHGNYIFKMWVPKSPFQGPA